MPEEPLVRRLAAILHADVVDSTTLVQRDEALAHARIRDAFRRLAESVGAYGGSAHEIRGDALVAEFSRASDAVCAALAFQIRNGDSNRSLSDELRPEFRIGISLAEVVVADGTITGAGVVIAQRLEQLAGAGGVIVQSAVSEAVPGRMPFLFENVGARKLKGFEQTVRAYVVSLRPGSEIPAPEPGSHGRGLPDTSGASDKGRREAVAFEKPSIAVLAFDNMSGDPEQEYFADGIAEELITSLGRCRWLLVISRNSTFAYRGTSTDARQIAQELGARYVLEGSVRRSGARVRVTTQLIDGRDGSQLWSEGYDRELDDVFALQEEIAGVIAGTIRPELESVAAMELRDRPTTDLNAWDSYQRGLWHLYRFTTEELETAKTLFERAIELDAGFSQAQARLAYVLIQLSWYGPRGERLERVNEAARIARQAIELDRRDPAGRLALGRALTLSGQFQAGIEELRAAVQLDPNYAQAHFALGQALCSLDRHDEALREIDVSIRLSPRDPHMWTFLHVRAIANYTAGHLEQAEADERAALRQPNVTFYPFTVLVAILGRAGKTRAATEAIEELQRLRPGFSCREAIKEWCFGERPIMTEEFMARFVADIRSAGLPE